MKFIFYSEELKDKEVLSVDGIAPRGPNLSHWPKNRTPKELKADTSTEIVLKWNRSDLKEKLLNGIDIVTNNHYDTDGFLSVAGILCSELLMNHEKWMIDAATTGDFRRYTSDEGLKLDWLVINYSSSQKSPIYSAVKGCLETEKRQMMYDGLIRLYPEIVKDIDRFGFLFEEDYQKSLKELEDAKKKSWQKEYKEFGLSLFLSQCEYSELVVNSLCAGERILMVIELGLRLYHYEFRYTVDSWFELEEPGCYPRKELMGLAFLLTQKEKDKGSESVWLSDFIEVPVPRLYNPKSFLKPEEVVNELMNELMS